MGNRIKIILPLIFLLFHLNFAYGKNSPATLSYSDSLIRNINIESYDFLIETIELEGIVFNSTATIRENRNGLSTRYANYGKLMFTSKSFFMDVLTGNITMKLLAYEKILVFLVADAGNKFEFEPDSFTIKASATNLKDIFVSIDGIKFAIRPGEIARFVDTSIFSVNEPYGFSQNESSFISIAIFGSAYLDVSSIELNSLFIDIVGENAKEKTMVSSTIKHLDNDGNLDLVVKFKTDNLFIQNRIGPAILRGILNDGTIINGKANVHLTP